MYKKYIIAQMDDKKDIKIVPPKKVKKIMKDLE